MAVSRVYAVQPVSLGRTCCSVTAAIAAVAAAETAEAVNELGPTSSRKAVVQIKFTTVSRRKYLVTGNINALLVHHTENNFRGNCKNYSKLVNNHLEVIGCCPK